MFKQLQQVGKAFMLPIAILPAAGLLLGIGGALSNKATVQAYPILNNEALQGLFQIMSAAGSVVFANLLIGSLIHWFIGHPLPSFTNIISLLLIDDNLLVF